jgi:hypothetical protein
MTLGSSHLDRDDCKMAISGFTTFSMLVSLHLIVRKCTAFSPSIYLITIVNISQVPVAPTCNSGSLGGWNQEDHGLRPALQIVHKTPISKITRAKWTRVVTQEVEHLLCKYEPHSHPPKKLSI